MSMILGKYKNIKRLGKGAFGDVLLVKDEDQNEFAIKMINKKLIQKDAYLEEYLEGEKQCMMSFKSPYIMQLLGFQEDDKFKYMICEYCNGGDLLNCQAKQPNKIFTLDKAVEILAEIIKGLQLLHENEYVHRDIKPQNILIKMQGENKPQYKLADFGFAKKSDDVGGTVLGTEHYMSPEIFTNEVYGFQVDMWAFGVLFYFMLNMDYPFKTNPHLPIEKKRTQLIKQAENFSYKAAVEKSKKKIVENCTPQMEDLFSKIFTIDPDQRINWVQIREHQIFKKHFPIIPQASRILYKNKGTDNKFVAFVERKSMVMKAPKKIEEPIKKHEVEEPEDVDVFSIINRKKNKEYPEEKQYLELKYEKINFLLHSELEIIETNQVMEAEEIYSLRYNLLRYYIILLKEFMENLKPQTMEKQVELNWAMFMKTNQFKAMLKQYESKAEEVDLKLEALYDQCIDNMDSIKNFNSTMENSISMSVQEGEAFENIKQSYRSSTKLFYSKLRKVVKKGTKHLYFIVIITMCHSFSRIMHESENDLKELFLPFLIEKKVSANARMVDFSELRHSLTKASEAQLKEIIKTLYSRYFS